MTQSTTVGGVAGAVTVMFLLLSQYCGLPPSSTTRKRTVPVPGATPVIVVLNVGPVPKDHGLMLTIPFGKSKRPSHQFMAPDAYV